MRTDDNRPDAQPRFSVEELKTKLAALAAQGRGRPGFGVIRSQPSGIYDFKLTGLTATPVDCHVRRIPQSPPAGQVLLCNLQWDDPADAWIAICHDRGQPNWLYGYLTQFPVDRATNPLFRLNGSTSTVVNLADVAPGGEVWDAADFKARLGFLTAQGRGAPGFGVRRSRPSGIYDFKLTGLTATPVDCHVRIHQSPPAGKVLLCNLQWDEPAGAWIAICHDQVQPHLLHGY
ncbi:hypothetical protein AB0C96_37430, partial [Streptomyces sp. NPDC048506]|uniref:hypothetical protein n=1 Tax=Streptomyces sp. NPDC048506 TaxID=3155028 RepID=UPI00343810C7